MSLGQSPLSSVLDLAWRTAFRIGFPLLRAWWRLRRPLHEGALVAIYAGPRLLLVRPSYRDGWTFPGGGLQRGETPEAAARREMVEEIGFVAPSLLLACVIRGSWDGQQDKVNFFELRLDQMPNLKLDNREIIEARFVSPDEVGGMRLTGPVAAYLARTFSYECRKQSGSAPGPT